MRLSTDNNIAKKIDATSLNYANHINYLIDCNSSTECFDCIFIKIDNPVGMCSFDSVKELLE